jgi:hypothetical protein
MHKVQMKSSLTAIILGIVVLLTACGGGSGKPAPAAPTFTSTASQSAAEGAAYTYTLVASATDGSPVTYHLTTAPTGATLSGDTITWTPTWAQTRIVNNFTATATTAGGSATQTWTVTPSGSIHGSFVNTYWTAQGATTAVAPAPVIPGQIPTSTISAMSPLSDGSLQVWPGTRNSDGTFIIPNVPAGYYWLRFDTGVSSTLYWTNSSTFDDGADLIGRPLTTQTGSSFAFNLTGLDPWTNSDSLALSCPNAGWVANATGMCTCLTPNACPCASQPANAATTFTYTESIPAPPIDSTQGDVTYVLQYEPTQIGGSSPGNAVFGQALGPVLSLPSLTVANNATTPVAGALSDSAPQSLDINVKGSAWQQIYAEETGQTTNDSFLTGLSLQPFVTDRATFTDTEPLALLVTIPVGAVVEGSRQIPLLSLQGNPTTDQDLGPVQYNNPFPATWLPVLAAEAESCISLSANQVTCASTGYLTTSLSAPITPPMSPVQSPTLNGTSLFAVTTSNSTTPALSWKAPTGLTPSGYVISITQMTDTTTSPAPWRPAGTKTFYTSATSLTIPPGILSEGTYLFVIEAIANGRTDFMTSPRRAAFPYAFAQATSGLVTIGASSSTSNTAAVSGLQTTPSKLLFFDRQGQLHQVTK